MSRRCELTGIGPMVGHSVSHSNIKTKRRFLPSLKTVKVASEALGQTFSLRISNAALRTLDYKGGLDAFIVKARDEQLSATALRIKRQVRAKLAENAAARDVAHGSRGRALGCGRHLSRARRRACGHRARGLSLEGVAVGFLATA